MTSMTGMQLILAGDVKQGLELLRKALAADGSPMRQVALGVAYLWIGQFSDAATHFDELNAAKPRYADKYYKLAGVAKWCLGKTAEAVCDWKTGIRCDYGDGIGNLSSGLLLYFASVLGAEELSEPDASHLVESILDKHPRYATESPGPFAQYLLGRVDDHDLCQWCMRGVHDRDTVARKWRYCFYRGVRCLHEGDIATYRECFRSCLTTDNYEYHEEEFYLARHEVSKFD